MTEIAERVYATITLISQKKTHKETVSLKKAAPNHGTASFITSFKIIIQICYVRFCNDYFLFR